jgi:transaldolase
MASFETIASGIAQHAGTYADALAVPGGLERAAEEPSPAAGSSVWRSSTTYADRLAELSDRGASIWLERLSRGRLNGGGLAALVSDRHVVGVTSGPTILEQALADSAHYDSQVLDLGLRGVSPEEAARSTIGHDVRSACDVLRPVSNRTGGVDGRASIAVEARVDHDTARTVAKRL